MHQSANVDILNFYSHFYNSALSKSGYKQDTLYENSKCKNTHNNNNNTNAKCSDNVNNVLAPRQIIKINLSDKITLVFMDSSQPIGLIKLSKLDSNVYKAKHKKHCYSVEL